MTDNKLNANELDDSELDTVNGGFVGNLDLNKMTNTKVSPDLTNMTNKMNVVTIKETKKDLDNLDGFNKRNPFSARFGLGKKFGRNQTKLDD